MISLPIAKHSGGNILHCFRSFNAKAAQRGISSFFGGSNGPKDLFKLL